MVAEPIQLPVGRGRPSRLYLESLRTANDCLRMEVHSLRRDRAEDIDALWPLVRRLEMVAVVHSPAALACVHAIEAHLVRMSRRERRGPEAA